MAAMVENRLIARLLATARTVTALEAINAVRDAGAEGSQLLRAKVAAQLADGTFRVLVDGKPLKLALPPGTRPGDTVTLRPPLPSHSASSPPAAAQSTAGSLSATGRLIAALLGAAAQPAPAQSRPLLDAPPATAAALAAPLARALEDSGLFYESHQARWAAGDYPLPRLEQEPQARLAREQAAVAEETAAAPGKAAVRADAPAAQIGQQSGDTPPESVAGRPPALQPVVVGAEDGFPQALSTEQAALVRQQLEMLAGRPLVWTGELCPGQPMRWEIDAGERDAHERDEPAEWTSSLTLEMPALGAVGARLTLGAKRVRLQLEVEDAHTLGVVRAALPQLAEALALAGMEHAQLEAAQRVARS